MPFNFLTYFARVLVLFTTLPIHEYAHGWVADKLGDPTARNMGRLDLNPLVHLDFMGSILILLTGFGWAKPVPVNAYYFNRKYSMRGGFALTALAGPMANILLSFVLLIIYKLALLAMGVGVAHPSFDVLLNILSLMISINIGLAVFNLLPIPPLDGYNVLAYFLPNSAIQFVERNRQTIFFGLMLIVWLTPIASGIIGQVSYWVLFLLDKLTFFLG